MSIIAATLVLSATGVFDATVSKAIVISGAISAIAITIGHIHVGFKLYQYALAFLEPARYEAKINREINRLNALLTSIVGDNKAVGCMP